MENVQKEGELLIYTAIVSFESNCVNGVWE